MKSTEIGQRAEKLVANYLLSKDFEILHQNWKTRSCEIDIVAKKDNCIYFVEVKSRASLSQGSGFDYITHTKLKRMRYAADVWIMINGWRGEYSLSGASVTGTGDEIEFIAEID